MIVPHHKLGAETLAAVIEEYVTRDGTEMTDAGPKVAAVQRALEDGELLLVYDPESCTCNIVDAERAHGEAADQRRGVEPDG